MTKVRSLGTGVAVLLLLSSAQSALAGTVVQCGKDICSASFSIFMGMDMSKEMGGGELLYDAESGKISLNKDMESIRGGGMLNPMGALMWNMPNGSTVTVGDLYGNADPILGFSLGASTAGAGGSVFTFSFDLPVSVGGPIEAKSSISYSLTALSGPGAEIKPSFGSSVLKAEEVDTDFGGLDSLNKGVDVGGKFTVAGSPATGSSPVYSATNVFVGDYDYDLMNVLVSFALTADSTVGISGFVSQTEVPIPAAFILFASALGGIGAVRRLRSKTA